MTAYGFIWKQINCRSMSLTVFVLNFIFMLPVVAAEITGISAQSLKVTRGDKVTLRVATSGESPVIEWWREGRIACRSSSCLIDTTTFSPGTTQFDVIIEDGVGVAISRIVISAADAPPLYMPKNLLPEIELPSIQPAVIPNGHWLIIERYGGISYINSGRSKEVIQSSKFEPSSQEATYSVAAGGAGIVRRVGMPEQVLVFPAAQFTIKNDRFELLSGRALWRTSPVNSNEVSQLAISGGLVDVGGPSLIGLEVGFITRNESRANIHNFQATMLQINCPGKSKLSSIAKGRAGVLILNPDSSCKQVDSDTFKADDLSAWIAMWSPWWITDQMYGPVDRWRSDSLLFRSPRPLAERLAEAQKLKTQTNCADTLDLLTARPSMDSRSPDVMRLVGYCQLDLGMSSKSLMTFADLNARNIDPAWSAFMMGRAYQSLNRHELALHWFGQARARGYTPASDLGRLAIVSAEQLKDGLEKLRWLEVIWREEGDASRKVADQDSYLQWRSQRPGGGVVSGSLYMDTQAVPLNTKTSKAMPIVIKASRSPVVAVEGSWWSDQQLSSNVTLRLNGNHDYRSPSAASLSFASSSLHDLGVDCHEHGQCGTNLDCIHREPCE